jgi:hypothetical protein
MRHFLRLIVVSLLLTTGAAESATGPQVLSLTATCRDSAECIFDNVTMFIDLTLTNTSSTPIGVPVEFLNQVGPHCVLIDNETRETLPLRTPPPPRRLATQ